MTNICGAVLLVDQTTCDEQRPRRILIVPQLVQVFPAFHGTQRLLPCSLQPLQFILNQINPL